MISTTACAIHRGDWARAEASPIPRPEQSSPAGVRLFVFGDAGEPGGDQDRVRAQLATVIEGSLAAGEKPIVLWLGDNLGPRGPATESLAHTRKKTCVSLDQAVRAPGLAELIGVVNRAQARGASSYAVLGERDWQCGAPELLFHAQSPTPTHPWVMPTHNYVVRVARDGGSSVVSSCNEAQACTLSPATGAPLVELILLDSAAWLSRHPKGSPADTQAVASMAQQVSLLGALQAQPTTAPRLLVMHHPVETAGPHGQGGGMADSAFLFHHPRLQQALRDGMFRGVVSAHDRSLQVTDELADGVKRSSRVWLDYPVFQVVAGATSKPDGRPGAGPRRWKFYQGQALEPTLHSTHAGFAELWVEAPSITTRLHAQRRQWEVGEVVIPVAAPAFGEQTQSPGMEPCLNCNAPTAAR